MNKPHLAVIFLAPLVLATAAGERSAAAQVGAPVAPATVHHRLGVDLGLASAVGSAGITYQLAPVSWLRLEGGLGYGPTGTQLSLMPKVAFGGSTCRFVGGAGASIAVGGTQAAAGHGPNPSTITWLNLDAVGGECRTSSGLSIQAALGVTMPLADFHYDVAEVGATVHAYQLLPQGRFGVGWWF